MAKMRGADIIAEYLVKEKVPYLFGLCGPGDIGMLDGFYDRQDKIKVMTVRQEQAAGHMDAKIFQAEEVDWIEAPAHHSAFSKMLVNESHGSKDSGNWRT